MPPEPGKPSLLELATARLRQLFPKNYQRMISELKPQKYRRQGQRQPSAWPL